MLAKVAQRAVRRWAALELDAETRSAEEEVLADAEVRQLPAGQLQGLTTRNSL